MQGRRLRRLRIVPASQVSDGFVAGSERTRSIPPCRGSGAQVRPSEGPASQNNPQVRHLLCLKLFCLLISPKLAAIRIDRLAQGRKLRAFQRHS